MHGATIMAGPTGTGHYLLPNMPQPQTYSFGVPSGIRIMPS